MVEGLLVLDERPMMAAQAVSDDVVVGRAPPIDADPDAVVGHDEISVRCARGLQEQVLG